LKEPQLAQVDLAVELLNHLITLASGSFQSLTVQDFDGAAGIVDDALALETGGGQADAWAVGAEHGGQEIVGDGDRSTIDAILGDEEPAREAFLDIVKAIAGGRLSDLQSEDGGVAADGSAKYGRFRERVAKFRCGQLESTGFAGDLNDFANWAAVQAEDCGNTSQAFSTENADFNGLAVGSLNDQRDQASIGEVDILNVTIRFIEAAPLGKIEKFQRWAQTLEFMLGQHEQDAIRDWLTTRIGSFPSFDDSQSAFEHGDAHPLREEKVKWEKVCKVWPA
jgi:hypothetical protein